MKDMPKMMSMMRSEKDKRKDMGEPAAIDATAPDYPWGLVLNLADDEIAKLGLGDLPKVGTEMMICCKVKVSRVEESAMSTPKGEHKEHRSMAWQVTDIGMMD